MVLKVGLMGSAFESFYLDIVWVIGSDICASSVRLSDTGYFEEYYTRTETISLVKESDDLREALLKDSEKDDDWLDER